MGTELLVVLPELIGDLRNGRAGDQELPVGASEGILDVAGGKPSRIHLHHEAVKGLGVAGQKLDELGSVGDLRVADLGHAHADASFGGAKRRVLVAVSPTPCIRTALVAASSQVIGLLGLEPLLHDVANAELRECRQDVRFGCHATGEQLADLLVHHRAGRYSLHGLGLLPGDCPVANRVAQAASHLQEL